MKPQAVKVATSILSFVQRASEWLRRYPTNEVGDKFCSAGSKAQEVLSDEMA